MMNHGSENAGKFRIVLIGAAALLWTLLLLTPTASAQDPCAVPDNGSGTVDLPPIGCDYLSPTEVHTIIAGLPPGTTIEFAPIHKDFICSPFEVPACSVVVPPGVCEAPGGGLGGNVDCFDSTLEFQVTGTGLLAGFSRTISIPAGVEIHSGPRTAGDPVQSFPTEMVSLSAQLFGDPDFDTLTIRAGSAFGLPSPGSTTLTDLGNGTFQVDSFFDIVYTIDFVGAPGSVLEGMSGMTQASLTMGVGAPSVPGLTTPMWLLLLGGLAVTGGAMLMRRQRATAL